MYVIILFIIGMLEGESVKKKKKKNNFSLEIKKLTVAYTFLLSALAIFIVSLNSFKFNLFGNNISYSIFILPLLYFVVNVILKEIGDRSAKIAIFVSTIVLYFAGLLTDILFGIDVNLFKYFGLVLAYFVSQFLNFSIYYYMLGNYRTPLLLVIFNLIFCLLVNNMLYMLFSLNMVFTSTFWSSYLIIICLQSLISAILAIILGFIEQGLDDEDD